nr:MAG TPA: hypothetical protein [Caudoviricetes sp.]
MRDGADFWPKWLKTLKKRRKVSSRKWRLSFK